MSDTIRRVFSGKVFSVSVESVTLPSGRTLKAELVHHAGSVALVPVTGDGDIVLVRQYRATVHELVWELPAGRVETGEDLHEAAIRECHEETGLIPSRLDRLGTFLVTPGYADERLTIFLARGLREPTADDPVARPDKDEDLVVEAFPRQRLDAMVTANKLIDLKTVAGLALLDLFRES
jgi:ADP-ribose pyrophosphatase